MDKLNFKDLGRKDYKACWEYQEELMQDVIKKKLSLKMPTEKNYFLLVEHPHVYTLGKSGDIDNLLINDKFLEQINATYFKSNRGGDITYHGPGQLVGYPIIDLEYFNMGVKQYVAAMEKAIINTLSHFKIKATLKEGATGVWLDAENPNKARKICAIGVRVSRYVTMHGFALNVNTDLKYFDYINPCGFKTLGVTSMEKELGEKVSLDEVKSLIKENFNRLF